MGRHLPTIALTLGLAAVLVTGCQQEPPIKIEPTAKPSESQTPTPKKPNLPAKAKNDDYAGAVGFVEYYYELVEYGDATGNWKQVKSHSLPSCHECNNFWKPNPRRTINTSDFSSNGPEINDLIDGIAQVNISVPDKTKKLKDGSPIYWSDVVKCVYKDGRWRIKSIDSRNLFSR